MKKTLEYLYIFSKLSTSFILLITILILGYFFYISFKNQEKSINENLDFLNLLKQNSNDLSKLSKKVEITDTNLDEIKKLLNKSSNKKNDEKVNNLILQIGELNEQLQKISTSIEKIKSSEINQKNSAPIDKHKTNLSLEKNKLQLAKLVLFKFENNLDFSEELNFLQNLNDSSKKYIFEKINLINLKKFRGLLYLKENFSKESDFFLKEKINTEKENIIIKPLMRFIAIEPSKKNIIKDNEINILNQINLLINQKKYYDSYQKILFIDSYDKYFSETINQLIMVIEFEKLIRSIS